MSRRKPLDPLSVPVLTVGAYVITGGRMLRHNGVALSGAPTTGSATSRQQPLPISPRRAVRSPHAAVWCDGGGTAPSPNFGPPDGRTARRAPHPSPLPWSTRTTAMDAVGGAGARKPRRDAAPLGARAGRRPGRSGAETGAAAGPWAGPRGPLAGRLDDVEKVVPQKAQAISSHSKCHCLRMPDEACQCEPHDAEDTRSAPGRRSGGSPRAGPTQDRTPRRPGGR